MENYTLYEKNHFQNDDFPFKTFRTSMKGIPIHWHRQIELLYILEGQMKICCNFNTINANPGDLILFNSNELHSSQLITDSILYDCIIFDPSLVESSSYDCCQKKYIDPMLEDANFFQNKISSPESKKLICQMVEENSLKKPGYELTIKSMVFCLLADLFKKHVNSTAPSELSHGKLKSLKRFHLIFDYIENNYNSEISAEQLSGMININKSYFCRLFKELTKRTLSDYVNQLRITRAEYLLKNTDLSITQIAADVGVGDLSYFNRLYKKYKNDSPSHLRKEARGAQDYTKFDTKK